MHPEVRRDGRDGESEEPQDGMVRSEGSSVRAQGEPQTNGVRRDPIGCAQGLLQPKTLVFTQHILVIVAKPCHTTSILPGSMRTTARRAVSQSLRRSGAVLGCTIDEYCHLWSLRRPQGLPLYEVPLRSCLFAQFRLNSSEHYHILYGGLCKTGKALTQCQKNRKDGVCSSAHELYRRHEALNVHPYRREAAAIGCRKHDRWWTLQYSFFG